MENTVGKILQTLGFIVIGVGILFAIIIATEMNSVGSALSTLFSSFVGGMLLVGFAEVIRLLEIIIRRIKPSATESSIDQEETVEKAVVLEEVSIQAEDEIREFLFKSNITAGEIIATPKEDTYIVTTSSENILIELGGFQPRILDSSKWAEEINKWYQTYEEKKAEKK
jgi:hypothetical protein